MITYDYRCPQCNTLQERRVRLHERDDQRCMCGLLLVRQMAAPRLKFGNRNDADQFTADALGIPVKELPSGLKTK